MHRQGVGYAAAAAATALAVLSLVTAARAEDTDRTAFAELGLPIVLAAGLVLLLLVQTAGTWAAAAGDARAGAGVALAVASGLLPLAAAGDQVPHRLAVDLLAAGPLLPFGVVVAVGRKGTPAGRRALMIVVAALSIAAAVLTAAAYDPFADPGCARICAEVPSYWHLGAHRTASFAHGLTAAAAVAGLAAVVTPRTGRLSGVATGALLSLLAVTGIEFALLARWDQRGTQANGLLVLAVASTPVAAAWLLTVALDIGRRRELEGVVAALSLAVPVAPAGGPVVGVDFARSGGTGWLDAEGEQVLAEPAGRPVVLSDAQGPVVRLHLSPRSRGEDVLDALTPATRLALRNAQLAAVLRARLRDVQHSQRRVVAASDAERSRIERDLHDGAQQRLVGVAFHLRLARRAVGADTSRFLARAEQQVLDVLAHLRRISHGTVPAVLADEGLPEALTELTRSAQLACRLDVEVPHPLPAAAATAAYVVVASVLASLGAAGPTANVVVGVHLIEEEIRVGVRARGLDRTADEDPCIDAADRVGALGGRWRLEQSPGTLEVEAVVPCGS